MACWPAACPAPPTVGACIVVAPAYRSVPVLVQLGSACSSCAWTPDLGDLLLWSVPAPSHSDIQTGLEVSAWLVVKRLMVLPVEETVNTKQQPAV